MQPTSPAFPERYFGKKQPDSVPTEQAIANLAPYKRFLVDFIKRLPERGSVLDIGCGSGKTIRLIRALRPDIRIAGMDITDMREFLPEDVEFKIGSVDGLHDMYSEASFDAVICQHVIEHLVSPLAMLSGIRSVLKPGGTLYLETPNWTRQLLPFSHLYFWNDYTHIHPYSKTAMHRLCFDHQLEAEVHTVSSCVWFPKRVHQTAEQGNKIERFTYDGRGPMSRAFARLVNPFMRDVLILIARKPA